MTDEERRATVLAELSKARRTLEAARTLAAAGFWDDAVSRSYYAAYHAGTAALAAVGAQARSHHGVHDLLFQHYVAPGTLTRRFSKDMAALQRYREEADYGTDLRFDQETGAEEIARAERVVAAIEAVLGA